VVRAVRVAGAVASALVLLVTGYGWTAYRELGARLVTSDVLTRDRPSDGVIDILLVGLDSRTDAAGNPLPRQLLDALAAGPDEGTLNTDSLILVRMPDDPALPTTAVSIPRDVYVPIPRHGNHKINSAYRRAGDAARARLTAEGVGGTALQRQVDQAGRRSLIRTVEQLTGASVDHYAEVNLAGFAEVTQAVGGVPVCLNGRVRDHRSGADFAAGLQSLQGPAALAFVRQRHGLPRGDLDRVVRQQAFLASLAHEVLSAGTLADPAELSALIGAVSRYVVVDPTWDLLAFAANARGLTAGAISFRTIPTGRPNLPTAEDGVAVQVDPGAVRDFVATLSEGVPASGTAGRSDAAVAVADGPVRKAGPSDDDRTREARTRAVGQDGGAPAAPITAAGVPCVN
jgi:LCP family protein required for cell wall assembly